MPIPLDADLSKTLTLPGLTLRPPADGDLADIVAACSDPMIPRWIPVIPVPYTAEDARTFLDRARAEIAERRGSTRVVADAETDRLLGIVGLHHLDQPDRTEIGWWAAPWGRRRGAISGAADAVTGWALGLGVERIRVRVAVGNEPSLRTALRAGYVRIGTLPAGHPDADGVDMALLIRSAPH